MNWKRPALDALIAAMHVYHRLARPMTLGVRAIVLDGAGRVFLVRHSYIPGWHLPGGGVEPGETLLDALARELREEAGLENLGTPTLFGVYFNSSVSRRDHVALYLVREFDVIEARKPDWEIRESGFFPLDLLPSGATGGTRARLAEALDGAPRSPIW